MRLNKIYINVCLLFSFCVIFNCIEEIPLSTENFEDVLVVEATITDEFKTQEIKITRTFILENNTPVFDPATSVKIETSNNNAYNFHHVGGGTFYSDEQFQAIEGVTYKLLITTSDGKKYNSNTEELAPKADLENLYAEQVNLNGDIGVQVLVDTNSNLDDAVFFRYEYEETYKIVAPYYRYSDIYVSNVEGSGRELSYNINFKDRPITQKNCYQTNASTEIILTNVRSLSENRITRFPVKFISEASPSLRDRYSILVRQYVQSANANTFYKILKELGGDSESVFVTNQPGFVQGNIFSQQSLEEKVVGFFEVSTVTSKRIYLNYSDFNLDLPPYYFDCDLRILDFNKLGRENPYEPNERQMLLTLISGFLPYKYVSDSNNSIYQVVNPECGDCSTFASNIKPEFWED